MYAARDSDAVPALLRGVRATAGAAPRASTAAARDWARELWSDLGGEGWSAAAVCDDATRTRSAACDWARSGAMALTGEAAGAPELAPAAFASASAGALEVLSMLCDEATARRAIGAIDGAALLGERAACLGLSRRGSCSAGGHCRLLATRDGWLALQLARPDDEALLEAWLETPRPADAVDAFAFAARELAGRRTGPLCERAASMGMAVAAADPPPASAPPWLRLAARGRPRTGPPRRRLRVLDLSALWAGPLATQLLAAAGARVVKVESTGRPDGTRRGPAAFHDLLNAGKASVALDLREAAGVRALVDLLPHFDVVIESARPRALKQLGIDAQRLVARVPGLTWVSITGHGREGADAQRAAFGDDAAVAAGTARALRPRGGRPIFCGDALADPLTGVHAALAAAASQRAGGGHLLALSLRDVTAALLVRTATPRAAAREPLAAAPPRARRPAARAAPLGADTACVLERFARRPC